MILPGLLAALAVLALAAGTPRQAALLAPHRLTRERRVALRALGLALLSGGAVLATQAGLRPLIGWIALAGIEALAVALLFTAANRHRD